VNTARILIELLLAVALVLGANVFDIVPITETPWLIALGWISLRLRARGWRSVGLRAPGSWSRTIAAALFAAIALQLLSEYVTEPLISRFTGQPTDLSSFKPLIGNVGMLLTGLALVWTLAAVGEELAYRGYLLNRVADLGSGTRAAWIASVLAVSVLFGVGHFYQGPTGVADTTFSALLMSALYLAAGRNLWLPILAHGFSDTIALLLIFFDLVPELRQ
jgi:uncharacterized protein